MPASEAQIRANQANAQKSTGPKTDEGKAASRANSFKHGLTATVLLPEREAAEVLRRYSGFVAELKPTRRAGLALTLHATRMSVRMEVCAEHRTAMLTERVRKALAEIEYPEGIDQAGAAKLQAEVSTRAMFDPSPEAALARQYEAAAERSFFRALKELRQMAKAAKAAEDEDIEEKLASILPGEMSDDEFDRLEAEYSSPTPRKPAPRAKSDAYAELKARIDVPISAGKRR